MELHDLWEQIVKLFLNTKSRVLGLTTRRWCLMDGTCALAASVRILHPLHNMSRHRYDSRKHRASPLFCCYEWSGFAIKVCRWQDSKDWSIRQICECSWIKQYNDWLLQHAATMLFTSLLSANDNKLSSVRHSYNSLCPVIARDSHGYHWLRYISWFLFQCLLFTSFLNHSTLICQHNITWLTIVFIRPHPRIMI